MTVLLRADDPVVVAARALPAGTELTAGEHVLRCSGDVPAGHKVAVTAIPAGHEIRKYGQPIGVATCDIAPGDHVHTHNMAIAQFHHDYAFGTEARHDEPVPLSERATFQGFVRADGRAATRNYLGILTSVNCSATAARLVASQFGPGSAALASYPNVDGVVALTHGTGCGMDATGDGLRLLRRTLGGYARHPNFAGLLVLGLGCEVNQVEALTADFDLPADTPVAAMTIQELGGTRATVREAAARIRELAAEADKARRTTVAVSELILGLECGGSDGFSGITANPALGAAADLLVQQGGTAVLGETPEIYGAEQLLTRRAVTREVGEKLVELIHWWERYVASSGSSLDSNPSPGNKAGGLTTILEKSLGAAAKGGTSDLAEVYHYAEQVTAAGLVFMDTPGYDPVSVTGMVAGGANVVCFTTGRGSVFGAKPAPSIKLVSNSATYRRMTEDMDINCGVIADGEATVAEVGKQVFDLVLEVASGRRTASEELGFGDEEFVPWQLGAVV
ncbi:MAG TPA: altronate dehydratase family protein [Streptosporangiaceae bacterium]|nr:altronate dehydratase family protein [Streptosporangiaceae bacterium]